MRCDVVVVGGLEQGGGNAGALPETEVGWRARQMGMGFASVLTVVEVHGWMDGR